MWDVIVLIPDHCLSIYFSGARQRNRVRDIYPTKLFASAAGYLWAFIIGNTFSERYGPTEAWYFLSISDIFDVRSPVVSAEINPCSPKMASTFFLYIFHSSLLCFYFQSRGVLLIWIRVGQGPIALAVGAGGGCLDVFTLVYLSLFFLPVSGRRPDID